MKNGQFSKHPFLIAVGVLAIFLAVGIWSIFAFVNHERQRDLDNWQITLGIMADSHANTILQWVDGRFSALNELAQNGSVQLYTQQLLQRKDRTETEPAQVSYLCNLVRTTAEREGFIDRERSTPPVPANVTFQSNAALILFDKNQAIITATPGISKPDGLLLEAVSAALKNGKPALYDIHLNDNNQPVIGFIMPIFGLQVRAAQQEPVGVLVGLQNAKDTLYPLFTSPRNVAKSGETLLVRQEKDAVVYLSPLADGTSALKRRLAANAVDLASAYAVNHPGGFMEKHDYSGTMVLAVSRSLAGLPWVLVQKINVDEALGESNTHRQFLLISLLLILLLAGSLLVAAWWHGSNVRERKISHDLLLKSRQLQAQTHVLNAINDNITDFIFLVDVELRLIFANKTLAKQVGSRATDLQGKTVSSVFGPATANSFTPFISAVLGSGSPMVKAKILEINGKQFNFHVALIPIPYKTENYDAVLVSLHDVTQLQKAQEKQARLLQQLVKAMMRAIDLHDPYSANHSAKTADIAVAIAHAMAIEQTELETLEIAANLCNLGKLSIPKELLAKTNALTKKEQDVLKKETIYATDILASIDFDGAVIDTIAQKNEYLDGSGYPEGLREDSLIQTARILAVANAFVAMISPRAYRDRLSNKEALGQLLQAADSKYDRQVIAALFHVVENEIDWSSWP